MAVVMARKHSANSSVRAGKGKFEPANTVRRNEIVEEIVVSLRPWKDRKTSAAITAEVNHELDVLLELAPKQAKLYDRSRNRAHAQQLDRALAEVETLLSSAPGLLAWSLFSPLPPPTMTEDGVLTLPRSPIDEIERAYAKRADSLGKELNRLRKICARAIDPGFWPHPNFDHAKHLCACFAHGLMQGLSKRELTGTEHDAFQTIASLLYESISGQLNASLKRACDSVLRGI